MLVVVFSAFGLLYSAVYAGDGGVSMSGPTRFNQQDGEALFQVICQGCHMADAGGAVGAAAYPALAHDDRLAAALYPVATVLKGRNAMPPLGSYLSDAQVAAVVNYLRTHFGNSYPDVVSSRMVEIIRKSP
jgi:mono/diheme cytochrome c family protein